MLAITPEIVEKVKKEIEKENTVRSIISKYSISIRAYYKIKNNEFT